MAKKRKAASQLTARYDDGKREKLSGKLGPINSYEDVADSEDEFHINQDKILLENDAKARGADDRFEFSDEEVLAMSEEDDDVAEDYESDLEKDGKSLEEEKAVSTAKVAKKNSDYSSDEEQDDDIEDDVGGWGSSKRAYYSNDAIETEADALEEEEEARRLQQKKLKAMTDDDFGVDLTAWQDNQTEDAASLKNGGRLRKTKSTVTEVLPELEISSAMNKGEQLRILQTRYPEFEHLAAEMADLQPIHSKMVEEEKGVALKSTDQLPLGDLKLHALSSYLGVLVMYFALLTSTAQKRSDVASEPENWPSPPTALPASTLRDHPIMDSLLKTRTLWHQIKDIPVPAIETALPSPPISPQEVAALEPPTVPDQSRKRLTKREKRELKQVEEARAAAAAREAQQEEQLAALTAALSRPKKSILKRTARLPSANSERNKDYGDEAPLTAEEAAAKAAQKNSLRFYTSQIASTAARRSRAAVEAGGDADLPYKERWRDRIERLNKMAEQRGKGQGKSGAQGVELGEGGSDSGDDAGSAKGGDEEEDYYDLIVSQSKAKKKAKQQAFDAAQLAARPDYVDETMATGPDGKRAITYAIEKNKGLAPRRKKEVRNPRVKKRNKYADKMKKLGSVRQVYRGGEGRGGYGGEATGIKKGLVRSVKL